MNFLAHLYLSRHSEELMIGNFIADAVKGKQMERFREEIGKGIIMHRMIDSFTDKHPIVMESKVRLRPKYGKFSPIIIDLYYDHFLAKNWTQYETLPLDAFARRTYSLLLDNYHILPPLSKELLPYMVASNWVLGYVSTENIGKALKGLSERSSFVSGMENAAEDLKKDYSSYENEFNQFFPELVAFTKNI